MSPTHPHPGRWKALGVLALSLFVVTVGNTILNVGLPTIRDDLGASASQLQWIVDGYLLVFAGLLLTAGSLGDRFGRRRASSPASSSSAPDRSLPRSPTARTP